MKRTFALLGAADWLSLAAAPTFALMALLTATADGGHAAAACTAAGLSFSPNGMLSMYLAMAAFHLAPWLRLGRNLRAGS